MNPRNEDIYWELSSMTHTKWQYKVPIGTIISKLHWLWLMTHYVLKNSSKVPRLLYLYNNSFSETMGISSQIFVRRENYKNLITQLF